MLAEMGHSWLLKKKHLSRNIYAEKHLPDSFHATHVRVMEHMVSRCGEEINGERLSDATGSTRSSVINPCKPIS